MNRTTVNRFASRLPRPLSKTARRRADLESVTGEAYDRNPCPHVLVTKRTGPAPAESPTDDRWAGFGRKAGRLQTFTDTAPCVRPGSHVHEAGEAERLHATDDGRTWK